MSSLLRPLLLLSVLFFLGSGLVATLFHWAPVSQPFRAISLLSYATMAPFQTYEKDNMELIVEEQKNDGAWTTLPLDHFLPLPRGERVIWMHLGSLAKSRLSPPEDPGRTAGYRRLAEILLLQEQKKKSPFSSIRLSWETWPISSKGYLTLRHSPFLTRTLLVQIP